MDTTIGIFNLLINMGRLYMKRFLKKTAVLIVLLALVIGMLPKGAAEAATKKSKEKTIVVTTQEELVAALKKYKSTGRKVKIKIETSEASTFTLNAKYSSDTLQIVIDAPNATIKSKATVSSITINQAKSVKEYASGNKITVNDEKLTFTAMVTASVEKLTIASETGTIKLVNNGGIEKVSVKSEVKIDLTQNGEIGRVYIGAAADISVSGTSEESLKVTVQKDAVGAAVKSEVPVSVNAYADVDLMLEKGAESSKITLKEESAGVKVKNNTEEPVSVKDTEGKTRKVDTGENLTTDDFGKSEEADTSEGKQEEEQPAEGEKEEEKKQENSNTVVDYPIYTYPVVIDPPADNNPPANNDQNRATIIFAQPTGGTITVMQGSTALSSGDRVLKGSTITITLTAAENYEAGEVSIGEGTGDLSGSGISWTVSNIANDVTISASFIEQETASAVTMEAYLRTSDTVVTGCAISTDDVVIVLSVESEYAAIISFASGSSISTLPDNSIQLVSDYSGPNPTELFLAELPLEYNTQRIVDLIITKFPTINKVRYRGSEELSKDGVIFENILG